MKKMFFVIFLLALIMNAQEIKTDSKGLQFSNEEFDDCNMIVIETREKSEVAYKTIGRLMHNSGFELETRDEFLQIITSKFTKKSFGLLDMGTLSMQVVAQIDNGDSTNFIVLTGRLEKSDNFISKRGMSGSPAKSSWNILKEFALKYPNAEKLIYKLKNN